ncbi:ORF6N domain-containing protein, partial [Escherichia coli]
SPRQPSGKNIIRWLLKKRTNGSVRYCQYTSPVHPARMSSPWTMRPATPQCIRQTHQ